MKTPFDPRHKRRQKTVSDLFRNEFHPQTIGETAQKVVKSKKKLDRQIEKAAPEFPIEKINKIDLAILRLACFELLIEKSQPAKVVIDEAIELAKEFGGDTSPAFINGALGNIVKNVKTS